MTRCIPFMALSLIALAIADPGYFPDRLIRSASASEQTNTLGWVAQGEAAALTRGGPEVGSATLLLLNAADIPLQIPEQESSAVITALIASLGDVRNDTDGSLRAAAARALGELAKDNKAKGTEAITALIASLGDARNDPTGTVRATAAQALGGLAKDNKDKGAETITALIASLGDARNDSNGTVRAAAAWALGGLAQDSKDKGTEAITALIASLGDAGNDPSGFVRAAAAWALGGLAKDNKDKGTEAITALIASLGDTRHELGPIGRAAVAQALGVLAEGTHDKNTEAIIALIDSLGDATNDFNGNARAAAAQALGVLAKNNREKGTEAVTALIANLGDTRNDMGGTARAAAAQALAALGKDNDDRVTETISALIAKLGDAGIDADGTLPAAAAAWTLGVVAKDNKAKGTEVITALIASLGNTGSEPAGTVRAAAAQALGVLAKDNKAKGTEAIAALIVSLGDARNDLGPTGRAATAQALGVLAASNPDKNTEAITALIVSLGDARNDLGPTGRAAAAQALGMLAASNPDKNTEAITALIASLGDTRNDMGGFVRAAAAQALGMLAGDNKAKGTEAITTLIASLGNTSSVSYSTVRAAAAQALGVLAKGNNDKRAEAVTALIASLSDTRADFSHDIVHRAAAKALTQMPNPLGVNQIAEFLGRAADRAPREDVSTEAEFHLLTGGDGTLALLLPVLRRAQRWTAAYDAPGKTLDLFLTIWPATKPYRELRQQIAWHTKRLADGICAGGGAAHDKGSNLRPDWLADLWTVADRVSVARCFPGKTREEIAALSGLFQLPDAEFSEGQELDKLLRDDDSRDLIAQVVRWSFGVLAAHLGVWVALLWLYPHHSWVQAVFFWNPTVRKLFGLHLTLLIPVVPLARRRLLAPFRSALGPQSASANVLWLPDTAWFPDAEVIEDNTQERVPVAQALPRLGGLTVLEGSSGLGKTVHLVRLARASSRVAAFLRAGEEGGDVIKAIAARLPADVMRDEAFLRMLIHAGGLDICIDGLNEVSADARAAVTSFAQAATKANVLISTQPIRWNRPAGARLLRLQPLRPEQRRTFLESREPALPPGSALRGEQFTARVHALLQEMESTTPTLIEERLARERALSNPMDLTTIAVILANGGTPDLLNLQETAYLQAAARYAADNQGAEFPLTAFSEHVYQLRCKAVGGERELIVLRDPHFAVECDALADYRLLLRGEEPNEDGKNAPAWRFRHDKVLDFFLYMAVTNRNTMHERIAAHVGDPRFAGVYLLLSLRAPLDLAREIRDRLADHAAETRDHSLADEVWGIVRQRLDTASTPPAEAELQKS